MVNRVLLIGIGMVVMVMVCGCRISSPLYPMAGETLTPEASLVVGGALATGSGPSEPAAATGLRETSLATGTATNAPPASAGPQNEPVATESTMNTLGARERLDTAAGTMATTARPSNIPTATILSGDKPAVITTASGMPTATQTPRPAGTFFPLGFMGPADEALFPQVATAGFNVVFEFRSIQEIGDAKDYLVQAEEAGLRVIQNMPSCRAFESDNPTCEEWNAQVWGGAEWAEFISTLATHDNLVAWFLPDEIDDPAAADRLYHLVKAYDPRQRPVFGNPGTFEFAKIARFPSFSDFLWMACYPEFYQEPRAIVSFGMALDAMACQGTATRWGAILQFFDSSQYGREGGHPTARELRADSYQAIIGGATGLWYFNYEMGRDLDGLLEAASTIAAEIIGPGGLEPVILSHAVPQTITKDVVSGSPYSPPAQGEVYDSIQTLQKEHEGTYLFAVNIAEGSAVVEFHNLPAQALAVEVLFEGRTIPVSGGSFQDNFAQDDVHIYRVVTGN